MAEGFLPKPAILAEIPPAGHAVVEASAGTGKTYAIEHLVADKVITGAARLDEVLVVTFTEKATTELRARIRKLLEKAYDAPARAADGPGWIIDDTVRARLERALFDFDRAPIFTIHGFCQRVLAEQAFHSGQLFDQTLTDAKGVFGRAFRDALRTRLARDAELRVLLEEWLDQADEDALQALLYKAHAARWPGPREPLAPAVERVRAAFDEAALRKDYEGVLSPKSKGRRDAEAAIALLARAAATETPEAFRDVLAEGSLDGLWFAPGGKLEDFDRTASPATLAFRDELHRFWAHHLRPPSLPERVIDAFLPVVVERLEVIKRDEALLDFDDMLRRVWRAIPSPGGEALVDDLRRRYRFALIDEFQDTDELQWDIFRRVFVDSGDNALYVIGDPKQAIYAFRGADVHAYLQARDALTARGAPRVRLTHNYRSTPAVIEAYNRILDQRAPFFSGEITYDEPVACGRPTRQLVDAAGRPVPPVTLLTCPAAATDGEAPKAATLREAIGHAIARTLRRILHDPAGRLIVRDDEGERPVRASDVFILTRSGAEGLRVAAHLQAAGIRHAFYKQSGLFETAEAGHVRDLLAAVAHPHDTEKRLRAWATPFFAVPWPDLPAARSLSGEHPLVERLFDWHHRAERESLPLLFARILEESGLAEREVFAAPSERALTNYQHLFELLVEAAAGHGGTLDDAVGLLDDWIHGRAAPPGEDGDLQRLESERDAVQIMTLHKSKGLEAEVVFLFGGFSRLPSDDKVLVYHDDDHRRRLYAAGKPATRKANLLGDFDQTVRHRVARERREEEERLMYVGLTRAKSKLVLPYAEAGLKDRTAAYVRVNERLQSLLAPGGAVPAHDGIPLFEVTPVRVGAAEDTAEDAPTAATWSPPPALLDAGDDAPPFDDLRAAHAPWTIQSYSRLKAVAGGYRPPEFEEPDLALDAPAVDAGEELPGGLPTGRCLHEILETIDLATFAEAPDFETWQARDDVVTLCRARMDKHRLDPRHLDRVLRVVHTALTAAVRLPDGPTVDGLWRCAAARELEFHYPIPEPAHPLLARGGEGGWTVERGLLTGSVDLVFEHEGRVYLADWKSDRLPAYDAAHVDPHVRKNYDLQARIYTVGVLRLLGIRDRDAYEERFGGLLYVFLRGPGFWRRRPSWDEVVEWEDTLVRAVPEVTIP